MAWSFVARQHAQHDEMSPVMHNTYSRSRGYRGRVERAGVGGVVLCTHMVLLLLLLHGINFECSVGTVELKSGCMTAASFDVAYRIRSSQLGQAQTRNFDLGTDSRGAIASRSMSILVHLISCFILFFFHFISISPATYMPCYS